METRPDEHTPKEPEEVQNESYQWGRFFLVLLLPAFCFGGCFVMFGWSFAESSRQTHEKALQLQEEAIPSFSREGLLVDAKVKWDVESISKESHWYNPRWEDFRVSYTYTFVDEPGRHVSKLQRIPDRITNDSDFIRWLEREIKTELQIEEPQIEGDPPSEPSPDG
ncbi:hypothetical protein OAU50_03340 [Planctomycetota bacterium]|nr:hypothetical protein [Planctomycetota bacterium]